MKYSRPVLGFLFAFLLVCVGTVSADAQKKFPRQYYKSSWEKIPIPNNHYYVLPYYFKTNPADPGYKSHFVIYYPNEDWMYYFNPKTRTYWCRALISVKAKSLQTEQKRFWVVLAKKDVKPHLSLIPEEAWDRKQEVPLIPGTRGTPWEAFMEYPPLLPPEYPTAKAKSAPKQ